MAQLSFLWHLHQPSYRTADGVSHAPWAALHAGGAYRTLAAAIRDSGGPGQVLNIVPSLVEQLVAYRDGSVHDPVLDTLVTPAGDLSSDQRERLVSWGFHVTERQMQRYPRLAELALRRPLSGERSRLATAFGPADLRDLQVLFVLAQAGEQAWTDDRLAEVAARGRSFTPTDHERVTDWLAAQPGELIDLWQELAAGADVEISTSPFAHPIMPLLIDTAIVEASWAPHPAPEVPRFCRPEDARWQLDEGLRFMRSLGLDSVGCWPPEGSVSADAVALYADAGVAWLVTDEGILEKSLGRPLRTNGRAADELYRPWQLSGASPTLFFRDRELSDAIGFSYGRWDDERRAAHALLDALTSLARSLPSDATLVLALDGENPWLHYPDGGGRFLRELMAGLRDAGDGLEPTTLARIAERAQPATLDTLHPGSWINGTFATWIGHPEKSAAWQRLGEVHQLLDASATPQPPSLLVAEASDWFWWLGDDNPTELAPLYDAIFRNHLVDACRQAGVPPPASLDRPIKLSGRRLEVPVTRHWRPPRFDGQVTSYFEWCLAAEVAIDADHAVDRLAVWADGRRLYLLLEGARPLLPIVRETPLTVHLELAGGNDVMTTVDSDGPSDPTVELAVDAVVELGLAWDGRHPVRLHLHSGQQSLLAGSVLVLEPIPVDEASGPDDEE